MAYEKNVFIFGIGASVDAGTPLLKDFLNRARSFYDQSRYSSPNSYPLTPEECKAFYNVFQWRAKINPSLNYLKVDLSNLEDLFSLMDMAEMLGVDDAADAKTDLIRVTLRTIELTTIMDAVFESASSRSASINLPQTYLGFTNWIKRKRKTSTNFDSFITLNYDTVMEQVLNAAGIPYTYGKPWDTADPNQHKLLKLHGSASWGQCPDCSHRWMPDRTNWVDYRRDPQHETKADACPVAASQIFQKPCDKCSANNPQNAPKLRPLIVPPTWNKGTSTEDNLTPVWQAARNELAEASRIIIIGYSLPETDSFFKYLLALGLSENVSLQEIILVDPASGDDRDALGERYRRFISSVFEVNSFHFINATFGEWVEAVRDERGNLKPRRLARA